MAEAGKLFNRYVSDYTLFDLETTGISRIEDRIVEISAVKVRGGVVVDEYSMLVNPEMKIPYDAMRVNHITDDMVKNSPVIKKVLPPFFRFVGNDVLVGHNIHAFDIPFIVRDCQTHFNKIPPHNYVDTLKYAKSVLAGRPSYSLTNLAEYFGIGTDGAHRALNDCRMNQQVFEALHKHAVSTGVRTCPVCGSVMKMKKGNYGEFFGCTAYPVCTHTEKQ